MKAFLIFLFPIAVDIISVGLMSYGAYLIYPPAGFIVLGALLWVEVNINVHEETPD